MPSVSTDVSSETGSRWARANTSLETFLENYCRVTRPERDSRRFERFGIRRFYWLTTTIYHEPMFPTVRELREGQSSALHPARVKTIYADSGYYETVNLIYC